MKQYRRRKGECREESLYSLHMGKKIQSFLSQRPVGNIYHYASATATLNILSSDEKHLRATSIRHLNDSSEYVQAQDRIVEQLDKGGRSDVASVLSGDKTTNTLQDI